MRLSSTRFLALLATMLFVGVGQAQIVTGVTNISNTPNGSVDLGPEGVYRYAANSFTTGSGTGWSVSSVTLTIVLSESDTNQVSLNLFSDASGTPGSVLGSFTGVTPGVGTANYNFNPVSSMSLAANTTYWIVGDYPVPYRAYLQSTMDLSQSGLSGWSIGDKIYFQKNGTWESLPNTHQSILFQVNVQAVPEPGSIILTGLALAGGAEVGFFRRRKCKSDADRDPAAAS